MAEEKRNDGFYNTVIGHGLKSRDPLANTQYTAAPILTDQQLAQMYYGNALVRRIIDLPAEEAVKNWIKVDDEDPDERALQMLDDLGAEEHFANALRWSRLFGGSAILMTINDGGLFEDELRENNIDSIEAITVYDRREVIINNAIFNDDPRSPAYGRPEWYEICPSAGGLQFYAHRSRVLIFDGDPLPNTERIARQGWGLPTMQGLADSVANNDDVHRLARLIVERMSQSVTKLEGLLEQLATEDGEKNVQTRLQLIDMARSILNTVAIDAKDDFQLHNMSLTNLPELIDRFGLFLSALTGIPFTVLFGRSPAGMNATGESDNEIFYSLVRRLQKRRLKGNLDRLVRLCMLSKRGLFKGAEPKKWAVVMNPLWLPSSKEEAETRKLNADADKAEADAAVAYAGINAVDSSEIRKKLDDDGKYPIDMSLDLSGEVAEEVDDDGAGEA